MATEMRAESKFVAAECRQIVVNVVGAFDQLNNILTTPEAVVRDLVSIPLTVLKGAELALDDLLNIKLVTEDTFDPHSRYWNATYLEGRCLVEALHARVVTLYGPTVADRLKNMSQRWEQTLSLGGNTSAVPALSTLPFIKGGGLSNTKNADYSSVPGVREAQMSVGDSIQTFSIRETGDVNNVAAIVAINGLVPPFFISDTTGKNRKPGVACRNTLGAVNGWLYKRGQDRLPITQCTRPHHWYHRHC